MLAVEDYPAGDVEAGVVALIKGVAPGVNPSFLPPPAAVGAECRRQMNLRLDSEARTKVHRPQLPPPMVEHTPESRGAIKAMVDGVVERSAEQLQDDASTRRKNDIWSRTNERFAPDMDPDAMRKRLHLEIGDPEDEAHAA